MNQKEFVTWKLEEIVKKREELKEKHNQKRDEYLKAKEEFENSDIKQEIEEKKSSLLTLQERHKKELDELKERHIREREIVMSAYVEVRDKEKLTLNALKAELNEIFEELGKVKSEASALNKEKHKLKDLEEVNVTSHAIVQYLNRATGMDIEKIRTKVRKKMVNEGSKISPTTKIQDHQVVDYLVNEDLIDLEQVEAEILPESVKELIMSNELLGSTGTFTTKDGFRLAVSGGKVVTFLPKKEKSRKKKTGLFKREKRTIRRMKL
jgi:hypothetical protein